MALGNHVHEKSVCPEECVHSPPSVERVRHSVCFLWRNTYRPSTHISHGLRIHTYRAGTRADSEYTRGLRIHTYRADTHWQLNASGAALVICCNGRINASGASTFTFLLRCLFFNIRHGAVYTDILVRRQNKLRATLVPRHNLFCGETHLTRQHAFPRPIACLASNSAAYCACPEEYVPSPASVERVRHSVCFLRRDTSRASARVSATNRELGLE